MTSTTLIQNPALKRIIKNLKKVTGTGVAILLEGETGTGKNHLARQVHTLAGRPRGTFLPLVCGALPETLFESELFGYEKGAFTGAHRQKTGLLEVASGGTLFLDEIENLSPAVQGKLLRVLDEKKFFRLGGLEEIEVAFQLICASNRSLKNLVEKGAFRDDLYYRIAAVHIVIPLLCQRPEDILPLAKHFLNEKAKTMGKQYALSKEAERLLLNHPWPGNVRQLKDAVQIAAIFAKDNVIKPDDFTVALQQEVIPNEDESLTAAEKRHLAIIWPKYHFNRTKTAKALKITETTLRNKIKKYGL